MAQSPQPQSKIGRKILLGTGAVGIVIALIFGIQTYRNRDQDGTSTNPTVKTDPIDSNIGIESVSGVSGINSRGDTAVSKLLIRLSEGQALPDANVANPLATGTPLTEAEIAAILARLPELVGEEGDKQEFNLPDALIPPPQIGATVDQPFPPPPTETESPLVVDGPLEVLRFTPEGEVGLAPFINVTFNQPMVALTSLESLNGEDIPVTITPELPGVWQWVSPQTLRFEFQSEEVDRLPMATEFVAEIPAGTQSANGNALAETVRWTFSTPPVQMVDSWPMYEPQPLEPIIFIAFDQLIEPTAVLSTIQVTADGNNQTMRLATDEEILADERVSRMVNYSREGYWLALHPERPLPTDSEIIVTIGPDTPSAEGPRLTTDTQSFTFYTYPPLRLEEHNCGWSRNQCPPLTPFHLHFNNPIDPANFDESMILIEPELSGATVQLSYNSLTIQGLTEGRTTYQVTIDASLPDLFGQTLGEDEVVRFSVDTAVPFVSGPQEILVTSDPSASNPSLSLFTINYDELQVRAYAVEPSDWDAYTAYRRDFERDDNPPTPPGRLVMDETVDVDSEEDVLTEVTVDLSPALEGETGHLIVIIQPPWQISDLWERRNQTIQTWLQVTQIGLDAFVDHSQAVVWATNLADGSPLADISVTTNRVETAVSTDSSGLAQFALSNNGTNLVVAQLGDDTAILPAYDYFWDDGGWQQRELYNEIR